MTDESRPVIGKGNYKFPCDLISVVSCLHSHLTAGNWGHSTASSCHFFTSLVIFGIFLKLLILNGFVFQYASSPSDCTMNLKGTKSREANKNNSSWTAITTAEFLRLSWVRKGKGAKLCFCCLLFVSERWSGSCLPKVCRCGWGTTTGETRGCFLSVIYRVRNLYLEVYLENFFSNSVDYFSQEKN